MTDKYEVAPGLWIGSEYGDLIRERKKLIAKYPHDEATKQRIKEITDRCIEIKLSRVFKNGSRTT